MVAVCVTVAVFGRPGVLSAHTAQALRLSVLLTSHYPDCNCHCYCNFSQRPVSAIITGAFRPSVSVLVTLWTRRRSFAMLL